MPYTNEKTIEDKNTIKSRTYFHCGPQHKTSGEVMAVTVVFSVRAEIKRASNCTEHFWYEYAYRSTPSVGRCDSAEGGPGLRPQSVGQTIMDLKS